MGYYGRGDYYRGDYYRRGDPGFFSSVGNFLGHVAKGAIDIGTGNFGGAISEGLGALGISGSSASGPANPPPPPGRTVSTGTSIVKRGIAALAPVAPGAALGLGMLTGGLTSPGAVGANGVPHGYHISKKTGRVVRNRHMNPLNVRALRRADRRAHAFLRISRHLVRHYVAKQPKGRSYIHTRRKKR